MPTSRMARESAGESKRSTVNTVRLDFDRLRKLLDALDAKDNPSASTHRKFVRWPFRHACVPLSIVHADRSRSHMAVACRNISRGGLSILHSAYVYPGSVCEVTLPRLDGAEATVTGTIARCNHLGGVIHEVGIRFKEELRIGEFVEQGAQADLLSIEKVDHASLEGEVLLCGLAELDDNLLRHHLRATSLRVVSAAAVEDAREAVKRPLAVVFIDAAFDFSMEPPVSERLRSAGMCSPLVVLTTSPSDTSLHPSTRLKADAVLTAPITDRTLLQIVAGLCHGELNRGLCVSALPPDHPSACLVPSFIEEIKRQAAALEPAVRAGDAQGCLSVCRQLGGIAPIVGFEAMSALAGRIETALVASGRVDDVSTELQQLLNACSRARAA